MSKPISIASDRLRSFIERIEKLIEERHAIQGDIRDVFSEAKGVGYDIKTMRKVIALRAMDAVDRDEQEALLDTYLHALGMVDRIEERLAAGESARKVAAAVGASKSTVHRVSQKRANAENGTATETGELQPDERPAETPAPDGGVGTGTESLVATLQAIQDGLTIPPFLDRRRA